jgi:type VII secretion protein EccE
MATAQLPPARQATTPTDVAGRPTPSRRRGRLGPLTTVQIVVVELAALAVLAALGTAPGRTVALVVAIVTAVVLLVAVFTPARGGWWYERARMRRRWHRRRRASRASMATQARDPRLAPLSTLEPSLAVHAFHDRGTLVGIGQDRDGWFSALAVAAPEDLRGERGGGVPFDRLARMCTDASTPVTAVSVVSHLIPALVNHQSPAVQSYRELLAGDLVPADQRLWVVVRLGPADASVAAASRGGGLEGVGRAMATLAGRVGKALAAADLASRVLDPAALAAALADSCRPNPVTATGDPTDERWDSWHADGLVHTCLQLTGWPSHPPTDFFTAMAQVSATLVAVAVTLCPNGDDVDIRCVVRLAAEPAALPAAVTQATALARRTGARVGRLDGLQAAAVYATAPTAAGVR